MDAEHGTPGPQRRLPAPHAIDCGIMENVARPQHRDFERAALHISRGEQHLSQRALTEPGIAPAPAAQGRPGNYGTRVYERTRSAAQINLPHQRPGAPSHSESGALAGERPAPGLIDEFYGEAVSAQTLQALGQRLSGGQPTGEIGRQIAIGAADRTPAWFPAKIQHRCRQSACGRHRRPALPFTEISARAGPGHSHARNDT